MNDRKYLNNEWKFTEDAETDATVSVRIPPHMQRVFPITISMNPSARCAANTSVPCSSWMSGKAKTLLLTFEGAAHNAEVFINDEPVYEHRCGYTAFYH